MAGLACMLPWVLAVMFMLELTCGFGNMCLCLMRVSIDSAWAV